MKLKKILEIFNLIKARVRRKLNFGIRFTSKDQEYAIYDIGEFTYGTPIVLNYGNSCKLKIGKFCSIAKDVKIILGGEHRLVSITTYPLNMVLFGKDDILSKGDVIIGNDVWIGVGATILSGVTIGDGAVIGANTVVSKSIEPYSIVVGNPAKIIKMRFSEETIKTLLKIKWWDWDIEKIKNNRDLLLGDEVNFLKIYGKRN